MSLNLSSPLLRNLVVGSLLGLLPALLSVRAQGRPPAAVEVSSAQLKAMTPQIVATGQVQSKSGADMAAAIGGLFLGQLQIASTELESIGLLALRLQAWRQGIGFEGQARLYRIMRELAA